MFLRTTHCTWTKVRRDIDGGMNDALFTNSVYAKGKVLPKAAAIYDPLLTNVVV
jgi:hypothetical protein